MTAHALNIPCPPVIGLCGPEGAGKSTAAKIIGEMTGYPVHPFAAPLKRMIAALGVDERHLYGSPADKAEPLALFGGQSARYAMQTLGTEWGRNHMGAAFWVRAWRATQPGPCITDDLRFTNEAQAIFEQRGVVIRIIRARADLDRIPRHASEDFKAIPCSFQVVNDKCTEHLRDSLRQALVILSALPTLRLA